MGNLYLLNFTVFFYKFMLQNLPKKPWVTFQHRFAVHPPEKSFSKIHENACDIFVKFCSNAGLVLASGLQVLKRNYIRKVNYVRSELMSKVKFSWKLFTCQI